MAPFPSCSACPLGVLGCVMWRADLYPLLASITATSTNISFTALTTAMVVVCVRVDPFPLPQGRGSMPALPELEVPS